jgi:hypothetical protein
VLRGDGGDQPPDRLHTSSAFVSIRQHMSAYVASIRQHTSAGRWRR